MKMEVRTLVALGLLLLPVVAVAQNAPAEQQTVPPPQPSAPPPTAPEQNAPTQAVPAQTTPAPQSPAPPRYPPSQQTPPQYQYPQSPPPPKYQYPPAPEQSPPPPQAEQPKWVHSDTSYPQGGGFKYHPFVFHLDGGGTITQRTNATYLNNGWNAGAGFTWYPTSYVPLGLRLDGTYNQFTGRTPLLNEASATYQTRIDNATQKMWGGDIDLEIDLHLSPYMRMYFLAGGGWYRQQTTYRQVNYVNGYICSWYWCAPGYLGVSGIVARNSTDWHFARNAGFGLEFAVSPRTSFFVEARYMRLNPYSQRSDFLPIRAGLRF